MCVIVAPSTGEEGATRREMFDEIVRLRKDLEQATEGDSVKELCELFDVSASGVLRLVWSETWEEGDNGFRRVQKSRFRPRTTDSRHVMPVNVRHTPANRKCA